VNPVIKLLLQGFVGTGAHRAADRIPGLEVDVAYWQAVAFEAQAKLEHADRLVEKVCGEKAAIEFENARLASELEVVTEGHRLLGQENDELAARLIETRQDLANARAISSRAPADFGPPVALPMYDRDATEEIFAGPLWDMNALKKTAA